MKIRPEEERDYSKVENLTREAFWNVYHPGCTEHFVLHILRKDSSFVKALDYVIEENDKIVTNIVYAKGLLTRPDGTKTDILMFGPISVLPGYQDKGYGSTIINFTLTKAKEMGYPAVVITGNPAYYRRFGFESASKHGIFYGNMDRSEEASFFMMKVLDAEGAEALKGTFSEPPCYFADKEAVDEFDKAFPPKVKEVRPGQLP